MKAPNALRRVPLLYLSMRAIHRWYTAKLGSLRLRAAAGKSPLRIVLGASGYVEQGWTGTEVEYLDILNTENWERYFKESSIDAILAEHVWEHLFPEEGVAAAENCFKYLRAGGYLRIAVPDGNHPDPDYIRQVEIGGTGVGASDHKILYTWESLQGMLRKVGFHCHLLEYFDQNGEFHGLDWDSRSGMIHRSRKYDRRNTSNHLTYTSLIIDAFKP